MKSDDELLPDPPDANVEIGDDELDGVTGGMYIEPDLGFGPTRYC